MSIQKYQKIWFGPDVWQQGISSYSLNLPNCDLLYTKDKNGSHGTAVLYYRGAKEELNGKKCASIYGNY
jgi:hypothetical protein